LKLFRKCCGKVHLDEITGDDLGSSKFSCGHKKTSIGKKIDPRTVTTLPRDSLLLFPVREACQSIFNGLPFRSVIRALRNGLKTIEDCGFCGRNSLS